MATNFFGKAGTRTGRSYTGGTGNWGGVNQVRKGATVGATGRYKHVCQTFQNKIDSFRTLVNQTRGAAKFPRPKPNVLNTFANWVEKGAIVQTVSCNQIAKWARTSNRNFNPRNPSVTACKNILQYKFGKNAIKCCARTKSGTFMVATTPTVKGKRFQFPKN